MSSIDQRLSELRIEWTQHPEKRAFIERQAQTLLKAKKWYTDNRQLEQKIAEAKEIFKAEGSDLERHTP